MGKVKVITDSNSGITQEQAEELGVVVLPMPFFINEKQYFEGISMSQDDFYRALLDSSAEVSTSQPSPEAVMDLWRKELAENEEIVHIPMSSGISSSCATALMLADEDEFAGRVFVVDNQRISITQRRSVIQAIFYFAGSLSPAKQTMIKAVTSDMEKRFANSGQMLIDIAHTQNWEEAEIFRQELEQAFPGQDIYIDNLSLSVSCHIGPGALAVALSNTPKELRGC